MKKRILIVSSIFALFVLTLGYFYFDDDCIEFDNPTLEELIERFGIDSEGLGEVVEKWEENSSKNKRMSQYSLGEILIEVGDSKDNVRVWSSTRLGANTKDFRLVKNANGEDIRELFDFASFVKAKILRSSSGCGKSRGQFFNTQSERYLFRYFFEYNINVSPPDEHLDNKEYFVSNIDIANKFPYKTGFYPAKYFEINDEENPSNSGKFLIVVYAKFD